MIRLTLKSMGNDIIKYNYQVENGATGEILYSKSRKATKVDNLLDKEPSMYYDYIHSEIMKMGKNNSFPKKRTIAWG